MLNYKIEKNTALKRIFILLIVISSITFQTTVFADTKESIAEKYRSEGYEQQQKGNFNEALSLYNKAVSLGLNNAVVFNDMGVIYERISFLPRARQMYLRAIDADHEYLPPYMNLGYYYLGQGKNQKAFEYLKVRYEQAQPGDPWAEKAKEEMLRIYPQYQEVVQKIEANRLNQTVEQEIQRKFLADVARSQEHFKVGQRYLRRDDYSNALREFDLALKLTPKNRDIIEAKKQAKIGLAKENIKERSDLAVQMLNSGDVLSAKREVQKILTDIPNNLY